METISEEDEIEGKGEGFAAASSLVQSPPPNDPQNNSLLNLFHSQSQIKSKNAMETWGLSYVTPSIVVLMPTSAYRWPAIAIGTKWQEHS